MKGTPWSDSLTAMKFTKTLQHTDAHEKGSDYIERLREEVPLYVTIVKAQALFEREARTDETVRTIMRRLEHIYAKVSQKIAFPVLTCSRTSSSTTLRTPSGRRQRT